MEKLVLETNEFVEMFGNDTQKSSYAKTGKLAKITKDAIVLEAERAWEKVEHAKNPSGGRGKVFILTGEKEELDDKVDGRVDNGRKMPLRVEQAFPIIVLEHVLSHGDGKPRTTSQWLLNMNIITESMFEASKMKYNNSMLTKESDRLVKEGVIKYNQDYLVDDYVKNEIDRVNRKFMSVVHELVKAELIIHQQYMMGVVKRPHVHEFFDENMGEYQTEVQYIKKKIELSAFVVNQIAKIERDLQNSYKYNHLSTKEIRDLRNMPIVKEYWADYRKELSLIEDENGERLYLIFNFQAHLLSVKAGNNPILKWLEKKNKEGIAFYNSDEGKYLLDSKIDFHGAWNDMVIDLANTRQNKFQDKEKDSLLFGGKVNTSKFEDDKFKVAQDLKIKGLYVEAYKKLQDNYGYNAFDNVGAGKPKQEKLKHTYANQYKDNLKTIQDVEEEASA